MNEVINKSLKGTGYTEFFISCIKQYHKRQSNAWIVRNAFAFLANYIRNSKSDDTLVELWENLYIFPNRYLDINGKGINKSFKVSFAYDDLTTVHHSFDKYCLSCLIKSDDISYIKFVDMVLCYYYEKNLWDIDKSSTKYPDGIFKEFDYDYKGPKEKDMSYYIETSNEVAIKELELLRDIIDKRIKELKGEN